MMVQTEHVANIFGLRFLPSSDNRRALPRYGAEQAIAWLSHIRLPCFPEWQVWRVNGLSANAGVL